MNKTEAKKRIQKLRELINRYRYLYHVKDRSEISDAAHDSLKHELYELEQQFPDLITPDSPTQRVGGEPLDKFKKVTHATRMLSMEDVFSEDEFSKWEERLAKVGGKRVQDYYCMQKIDGLAISLVYKNGVLETAATRGDGKVGEDVTQNIKTIDAIPLKLREIKKTLPSTIEVRGEVFMSKKDFEQMNKALEKEGKKTFANPRNVSAGSVRQLDPKVTASRPLDFRAWNLGDIGQKTQEESIELLHELGFKTADGVHAKDHKAVKAFFNKTGKQREKIAHWIDGVVVRVNNHQHYQDLGVVGKTPRGLVAWKFPAEESTTKVLDVDWSVGRTGKLTPIARVEPTFIAGTTVQNATLHNLDEIKRLGLKIGDTVILTKAGDIIPKITKVLKELRSGDEKSIGAPKKCPVCGGKIERRGDQVDLFCSNKECFSMERERILHAARAFSIDGLGGKRIEHFINAGFLKTAPDIFRLEKSEIAALEGYGEKSADQIVDEIQSKKEIDLPLFIAGLGIPNVGIETAYALSDTFGSVEKLATATKDRLTAVQDIGDVVADSIIDFFASSRAKDLLEDYQDVGVVIRKPEKASQKLGGKSFVITGTLETHSREEAQDLVRQNGGNVAGSVSKKTDFVVVGENPGSKAEKAKKLGVKTLSEKEFLSMLS